MATTSLDPQTKRWLIALAVAVVVALVMLIRSVTSMFQMPPSSVAAEVAAPAAAEPAESVEIVQPQWIEVRHAQPAQQRPAPQIASTPGGTVAAVVAPEVEQARKEMLREQAEYLRKISAENKDPDGVNRLTPEQIDEMQKNGIAVW